MGQPVGVRVPPVAYMRGFFIGLVVLMACNDPATTTEISLSGTWQLMQPSGWTDFRFTLTQGVCTKVLANDACNFAITGNAASTPAVCKLPGMNALSRSGAGYTCGVVYPVTGELVADSVTLNFGQYSDGASVDFGGRVAVDRSVIGDLAFSDASGVSHRIGGGCDVGPICLDAPGGQLHFIRGGTVVAASRSH